MKRQLLKPLVFLKEAKAELSKVTWPTRQEAIKLTLIVIIISLIVGIFIGGLDFIFTKTMQIFFRR